LGHLEDPLNGLIGIRRVGPEVIDHGVVKAQHRDVELADDDIFVVPAVA
jgi:hypothetical protein